MEIKRTPNSPPKKEGQTPDTGFGCAGRPKEAEKGKSSLPKKGSKKFVKLMQTKGGAGQYYVRKCSTSSGKWGAILWTTELRGRGRSSHIIGLKGWAEEKVE